MADSERLALADRLDTEHQHRSPWGSLGCTCPLCPDLRAAARALREAADATREVEEARAAAGYRIVPIVDDTTRQEVEALIAAIRAMRPDPTEPCPPGWSADDRQGDRNIYRAAELLAAAYLGRTDG